MEQTKVPIVILQKLTFSIMEYKFDSIGMALQFLAQNKDITSTNSKILISQVRFTVEELEDWEAELVPGKFVALEGLTK